jgi:hypothetical protein
MLQLFDWLTPVTLFELSFYSSFHVECRFRNVFEHQLTSLGLASGVKESRIEKSELFEGFIEIRYLTLCRDHNISMNQFGCDSSIIIGESKSVAHACLHSKNMLLTTLH